MTSQEIIDGAKCFECQIPPGMQMAALIYLWSQVTGITDVNTIMQGAAVMNKIPPGMQFPVLIYLMDRAVNP